MRFPRYSLRALLVLTTLVAVFFGLTAYEAEKRRHAIELLESNYAIIEYGNDFVGNWWTPGLFDEGLFREVNRVMIMGVSSSSTSVDELVSELSSLPEIENLTLSGVTDVGLHQLEGLPKLQQLVVQDCRKVTNEGFSNLEQLRALQNLSLESLAIDDSVLAYVADLPQLNSLRIKQTLISENGTANLQLRLPHVKIVYSERVLSPGLWP